MRLPLVIIVKAVEHLRDLCELLLVHHPLLDVPEARRHGLEPVPIPLPLEDACRLIVTKQRMTFTHLHIFILFYRSLMRDEDRVRK